MARSCCKRRVSREGRPWMLKQVQHDQGGGMAPLFHAILTARIYVYTLLRDWCNHPAPEDFEADSAAVRHERAGIIWSGRSEEHTSELQSLMRISYAVFCLKKKKSQKKTTIQPISRSVRLRTKQLNTYNTKHVTCLEQYT